MVIGLHIFVFWLTAVFFHAQNKPVYAAHTINQSCWFDPQQRVPCAIFASDNILIQFCMGSQMPKQAWVLASAWFSKRCDFLLSLTCPKGIKSLHSHISLRNSNFTTFFSLEAFQINIFVLFQAKWEHIKKIILFISFCSLRPFEQ